MHPSNYCQKMDNIVQLYVHTSEFFFVPLVLTLEQLDLTYDAVILKILPMCKTLTIIMRTPAGLVDTLDCVWTMCV